MTHEELDRLCDSIHSDDNRSWRAYVCGPSNFFDDAECPPGCGEVRVRMGSKNTLVGRVVVSRKQLAEHTWESMELLIDEIGISALLSHGDLYDEDRN